MKKNLTKTENEIYFYKDGIKKIIDRNDKSTYPSELTGDISSGLTGDISGLKGCATNITGNLNDCEITKEDREKGD